MGTRNLTIVVLDGLYRVAQYCQWDGYPSGQGLDVLAFCHRLSLPGALPYFAECVRGSSEISEEDLKALWVGCGAEKDASFVPMEVSDKFAKLYPHFHRDHGADILSTLMKCGPGLRLKTDLEFAADGLFCEWAYLLDLDERTLEAYEGFGKRPLTKGDRFHFLAPKKKTGYPGEEQYYPVKLVHTWPLEMLPSEKEFLAILEPQEEKEKAAGQTA
jgi:hypothetical protein